MRLVAEVQAARTAGDAASAQLEALTQWKGRLEARAVASEGLAKACKAAVAELEARLAKEEAAHKRTQGACRPPRPASHRVHGHQERRCGRQRRSAPASRLFAVLLQTRARGCSTRLRRRAAWRRTCTAGPRHRCGACLPA